MRYAIIENDKVANIVVSGSPLDVNWIEVDDTVDIGDIYINGEFVKVHVVGDRHITVLAFRNRFTQAEKITLDLASIDNPSASMASRQQSAALRVTLADLAVATFIDLDRPDTRNSVHGLESVGIIGTGRAAEILDAPIQDVERPKG